MAGTSVVVELWLKAKDTASSVVRGFASSLKFLDSEISVVSGKVRESLSGLFGGGVDGAIEFEAQLSKVAAKGGYTADEMVTLKKAAVEIGDQFGVTGTEAAQGMEALAAAGLTAQQTMLALPPVLALAKAEGISMDAAAEKLSDSLSTVGLGFDQAARMADVLAKGANISTTSASALADALATAGGIAKTAGQSLEQTVGALSALANAGIKGSAAGTALQAILTQLINPASQASKELSALGITSRDLGTVIGQLASKGDAGNAAILAFGETAGPGLRALIGQGQQSIAGLTSQLASSKGAAEEAATGINANLKGALFALQSAWTNVKTALFDPVLEPLTKQARELANTLNTNLASGALKPVQDAIRAFADSAIKAAQDFVSGFNFQTALKNVQDFAAGAGSAFTSLRDTGKTAADVVSLGWNTLASGFRTIGAALLETAASAVATLANMEEAASKIGLGSQQRANELRETALSLEGKAAEMIAGVNANAEKMGQAFGNLTAAAKGATGETEKLATAQQSLKTAAPVAELQAISKTLADYHGIAERANTAASKARQEYDAGKISAGAYGKALITASDANDDLAKAIIDQNKAQNTASPLRKRTSTELEAEAKSVKEAADRYGRYSGALQETGDAQAAALREEIALAAAKGNTATVVLKTVELAKLEAGTAQQVATAKNAEVKELQKAVQAQRTYLDSVGGGTQVQQQALQILQLKLAALQAEAEQAGRTAQVKALASQQAGLQSVQSQQNTQATQQETQATQQNTEAQEKNTKAKDDGMSIAKLMIAALNGARERTKALSDATGVLFEKLFLAQNQMEATAYSTETAKILVELEKVKDKHAEVRAEIAKAGGASDEASRKILFGANSIIRFFGYVAKAEAEAKKAYYEQKLVADELIESLQGIEKNGASSFGSMDAAMHTLNVTSRTTIDSLSLLNEEDLSNLNSALEAAKQKLQDLQDEAISAKDRLAELDAEIAKEKGNDDAYEKMRLQIEQAQSLREVEASLAKARAENNRDLIPLYEAQLQKLNALYEIKERNLEQAKREKEQQARIDATENVTSSSPNNDTTAPSGGSGVSGGITKTYQLNLTGTGGKTLTAFSNTDPSAFLDDLETHRLRSSVR